MHFALRAALPLALALAAASCSGSGRGAPPGATAEPTTQPPVAASAGCEAVSPASPGTSQASLQSDGVSREYILHIPPAYDGATPAPVVMLFHGYDIDAQFIYGYSAIEAAGDARGAVIVSPEGRGVEQHWNVDGTASDGDDIAFVAALLDALTSRLCLDAGRVYAAGYSQGGAMAQCLACALPDRIAAVGSVAAPYAGCRARVPLIAFHGMADLVVPFNGGGNGAPGAPPGPPVRRAVSEWARTLDCDGLPTISRPASEVELSTFRRCSRGDGEVLLYAVIGGGHSWPGADDIPLVGYTTHEIQATGLMLDFFLARVLPALE